MSIPEILKKHNFQPEYLFKNGAWGSIFCKASLTWPRLPYILCLGGRALDTWTHLVTWTQGHTDRQDTANVPQITGPITGE